MIERTGTAVAELPPGYFAIVMASGSISVGMHVENHPLLSRALLVACALTFAALLLLTAWRAVAYARQLAADLREPARVFGFFTVVAGADVLAARLGLGGYVTWAYALLIGASVVWLALGYLIPWTALLCRRDRVAVASADGSWFVWAVASQSVAVVAASLEPSAQDLRHGLALLAVVAWSVGCFLYAAEGILVCLRTLLYETTAADLTPTYWVAMGAASITVLAGARIVDMQGAAVIDVMRGLVAGLAVMFWAFATWLIPLLVCGMIWRHVVHRVPLSYDATWWSMVFPLGMYAIASMYLGRADRLPWVGDIGRVELWVAFAAWVATAAAMCTHLYRRLLTAPA